MGKPVDNLCRMEIVIDLAEGRLTYQQVADKYGYSYSGISRIAQLKRDEILERRQELIKAQKEAIKKRVSSIGRRMFALAEKALDIMETETDRMHADGEGKSMVRGKVRKYDSQNNQTVTIEQERNRTFEKALALYKEVMKPIIMMDRAASDNNTEDFIIQDAPRERLAGITELEAEVE